MPTNRPKKPFFFFYYEAWIEACNGAEMTAEQERTFFRFICGQWHAQCPIDDTPVAIRKACRLHLSRRLRQTIDELVAMGKLERLNGKIWSKKQQQNIDAYNRRLIARGPNPGARNPQPQLPYMAHSGGRSQQAYGPRQLADVMRRRGGGSGGGSGGS